MVETILEFPDNRLLIDLCGEFDRNLAQIEHQMGVHILRRGNRLAVIGDRGAREQAAAVLPEGGLCQDKTNPNGLARGPCPN